MSKVTVKLLEALKKEYGFVDSSLVNGCSVRVHDNPLLSDCVVNGQLKSDLEYKLQSKDPHIIEELAASVRNVDNAIKTSWDMPAGQRHISMSSVFAELRSHELEDTSADYEEMRNAQSQSEPASVVTDKDTVKS